MSPRPTDITYHRERRELEIAFDDGETYNIPAWLLRVYSPSAEVQGHGPGQRVLVTGKENVGIAAIEPKGNYAVSLHFDDGHDTGIYTWSYLHELGSQRSQFEQRYQSECDAS